jgi:cytochrome c556
MTFTKSVLGIATAAIISTSATAAFASEDAIKYRQEIFKAVGGHMTAMATILKTDAGDMSHMEADAGKTRAKANIWTDADDFKKVVMAFEEHAGKLAMAAKSGDKGQIGAALGGLGKNGCKACHDDYRAEK